jgi:uncharacterized protein YbbC (DUF1343 family)
MIKIKKNNITGLIYLLIFTFNTAAFGQDQIITGAQRTEVYMPLLKNKRVALVANHTSLIGNTNLVDSLLALKIKVVKIFCPEHGFRGKADAGEYLENYKDEKTGLPVISLYKKRTKPLPSDLAGVNVVIFDLQDVGVRFYTYISTMHYMMEACAENGVEFMVLDRPNPNGFYVDGPVLDIKYRSFVGLHAVPLVHGMTIAEYATMVNGEGWLKNNVKCKLSYVTCLNYDHSKRYSLPVNPSPNLQEMKSVYLYPSLGLFEGTVMSVGRGTDYPFLVLGNPSLLNSGFSFVPRSIQGASGNPLLKGEKCYGYDLRNYNSDSMIQTKTIDLSWLILAFKNYGGTVDFFNSYFNYLAGNRDLKRQIREGLDPAEIRKTWQPKLQEFKMIRKKYLLYEDFE